MVKIRKQCMMLTLIAFKSFTQAFKKIYLNKINMMDYLQIERGLVLTKHYYEIIAFSQQNKIRHRQQWRI